MSESVRHAPSQSSSEPSMVEELRDGIDKTRHELADSVDAGSSTLNGKAQASQRMLAAKATARVAPLLRQGADKVKLHRKQLVGAGVALVVALLGVRRRTSRARTRDHGGA